MSITPEQCRAARGLLGWSQNELATNAHVSRPTVADFETKSRLPIKNNINAIHDSMFAAGVEFLPEEGLNGVGVRFREQKLEYVKNVRVDRNRGAVSMPMRYAGEDFLCLVSFEALEDKEQTNFDSDNDYTDALARNLHFVLAIVEPLAKTCARKGECVVTSDMLNF